MTVQIAFLIDTDVGLGKEALVSNSICLTCIRLLHVMSSSSDKSGIDKKCKSAHSSVKWGYKFFSSKDIRTKIEFHNFYDIKLKYFEEFENEVQKALTTVQPPSVKNSNRTARPAQCISKSLTDILSDFQWEKPDITSPMKGRRIKREVQAQTNLVFLFSNLPKNNIQLKQFSGKQVPDDGVFLGTILPSNLFREFCHVSKVALSWIDTECLGSQQTVKDKADISCVQMIERALSRAGGQVYSLDAVVQRGCSFYTGLSGLLIEPEVSSKDPLSRSSSEALLSSTALMGNILPNAKSDNGWKCSLDLGSAVINTCLVMTAQVREDRASSSDKAKLHLETMLNRGSGYNLRDVGQSLEKLSLYGVLAQPATNWSLTVVSSFIVDASNQSSSGKYTMDSLLYTMIKKALCLVFLSSSGKVCLLEPVTVSTACLSLLSEGSTLVVEKRLLSQDENLNPASVSPVSEVTYDELIKKLTTKNHPSTMYNTGRLSSAGHLTGQLMERWHMPCSRPSLNTLINKLNQNMEKLDFLSADEGSMLKQLQKMYKQETQPAGLRDTTVSQYTAITEPQMTSTGPPLKGKKSRTSISRTEMILCKSKEVVKERGQREVEDEDAGRDKIEQQRPDIAAQLADFQSVTELEQYLRGTYDKVVSGETTGVDVTTQTLVTVALHYMKQTGADNPRNMCIDLLEKSLLLTERTLREKYINKTDADLLEQKILEYEVQVMLRLEILTAQARDQEEEGSAGEETVDQIVRLLRTLSFILDPGLISQFLQKNVLYNYMHTIPKTLANIYDELMQPLPQCLSDLIGSPNTSGDQSLLNTSLGNDVEGPPSACTRSHGFSQGSVGPPSAKSDSSSILNDLSLNISRRSRKLVHHPSLSDFGGKRQIVVEKMSKQEKKSAKKSKDKKKTKDKVAKALFGAEKRGTKLERRQSVAVMQRSHKTPKKASTKLNFTSPNRQSPRHKTVAETPNCKQQPLKRLRVPSGTAVGDDTPTQVIEESPEKACMNQDKDTPTKGKRAKALLRRSFYSAGPINRSRNMTQYFQLADKIAGRTRQSSGEPVVKRLSKLLSADMITKHKSPDKNSSFLLSQLAASPSPAKRTPRKGSLAVSVAESPSQHTRSRASPAVNLFKSPTTRSAGKHTSSLNQVLQSPVSRRQSPRILCPDSETKNHTESTKKTPKKSPVLGSVTFGLDSPSHAARKLSMTPTRKSVRAALFAKSPAAIKCQSPTTRGSVSRQSLLTKFSSPFKEIDECEESRDNTNFSKTSPSRVGNTKKRMRLFSPVKKLIPDNNTASCRTSASQAYEDKKENINSCNQPGTQRTPPQDKKRATKTPDSFDKWHRRKVRSVTSSPSVNKLKVLGAGSSCSEVLNNAKISESDMQKVSLKRSLTVSPDCSNEIRTKKQRTQEVEICQRRDSTLQRRDSGKAFSRPSAGSFQMFGSQGFDTTGSFSLSQKSDTSSIEYFSTTNDDVFLREDSQSGVEEMEGIEGEFDILSSDSAKVSTASGWSSPRFKSSVKSPHSSVQCSSPVFRSGAKSRQKYGDKTKPDESSSPRVVTSPAGRKFSPSVSAKSLMHLIQSPLLKSPESGSVTNKRSQSPHRKVGDRSRRSLMLLN